MPLKINSLIITILAVFLCSCGQQEAAQNAAANSEAANGEAKKSAAAVSRAPEATLDAHSRYLDDLFADALTGLEQVAATPAAQSGDWNGIKVQLAKLEQSRPGTYFYVLPDGNYYSLALDYTNLNLRDRGYFQGLFAGTPVKGFPIYSRSSGKKSALVAAPVLVDGKVTGAIGASVYLDDLHTDLNRTFALPPDYTWFVVDAEGNTMLDRDSDFIFMNTLSQGGRSLQEAVLQALETEVGSLQYESGGVRQAWYQKLPNMNWWMFMAKVEQDTQLTPQLTLSLERFVPELQAALNQIDVSMAGKVRSHIFNPQNENEIRTLLGSILEENANLINVAFIDPRGVLRLIEPSDYRNFEKADISKQPQVAAMQREPRPLFSKAFNSVEGFLAVDITYPVHDVRQKFAGSVSALIRPARLIEPLLKKTSIPEDYELWVMQPDGMIVYDRDVDEIGRLLFSNALYADYESLLKLGKNIAASPSGEGSYLFVTQGAADKVIKKAVWQSVRLHENEWRVILTYKPYE
jgi:hypothetical protein